MDEQTNRRRLPTKRRNRTVSASVGGHKVHVAMSDYEDGALGEVFVDMHKAGSTMRGIVHGFARLFSIALQYGVPFSVLSRAVRGSWFEPCGDVDGHVEIKQATSVLDLVMRILEYEHGDQRKATEADEAIGI